MKFIKQAYVGLLLLGGFLGTCYGQEKSAHQNENYFIKRASPESYLERTINHHPGSDSNEIYEYNHFAEYALLPRRLEDILKDIKAANEN